MDYHLTRTVTERDNHQHLDHPFTVPAGATRINIDFE
jgi:hypothetical protein